MFEFDYKLTGSGWSSMRIADGDNHAIITASYLSDALRFFLEAVALVVEGHAKARCSWDEEPGEGLDGCSDAQPMRSASGSLRSTISGATGQTRLGVRCSRPSKTRCALLV